MHSDSAKTGTRAKHTIQYTTIIYLTTLTSKSTKCSFKIRTCIATSMKHGVLRPIATPPLCIAIAPTFVWPGFAHFFHHTERSLQEKGIVKSKEKHPSKFHSYTPKQYNYKTTQLTFALLIVGDHQRVNLLFGIWFKPDRCALVSFLYFMDSSNPLAFSQNRPSHVGKYVPLKSVCSRMPSTPPRAWIMSVR